MDRNSQATWDIPSFPLFSGLPTPDTDRQTDTTKNQIKYSTKITFSALLRLQNSSFFSTLNTSAKSCILRKSLKEEDTHLFASTVNAAWPENRQFNPKTH